MRTWIVGTLLLGAICGFVGVQIFDTIRQATAESLVTLTGRKADRVRLPAPLREKIVAHAEARAKDISSGVVPLYRAICWIRDLERGPLSLAFLLAGIRANALPGVLEPVARQIAVLGKLHRAAKTGLIPGETIVAFSRPWLIVQSTEVLWPSGFVFLENRPVLANLRNPTQTEPALAIAASAVLSLSRELPANASSATNTDDLFPDLLNEFIQAENHPPPNEAFLSREEAVMTATGIEDSGSDGNPIDHF